MKLIASLLPENMMWLAQKRGLATGSMSSRVEIKAMKPSIDTATWLYAGLKAYVENTNVSPTRVMSMVCVAEQYGGVYTNSLRLYVDTTSYTVCRFRTQPSRLIVGMFSGLYGGLSIQHASSYDKLAREGSTVIMEAYQSGTTSVLSCLRQMFSPTESEDSTCDKILRAILIENECLIP